MEFISSDLILDGDDDCWLRFAVTVLHNNARHAGRVAAALANAVIEYFETQEVVWVSEVMPLAGARDGEMFVIEP